MSESGKWDSVVWKLVQQTDAGQLRWEPTPAPTEPSQGRQVGPAYLTTVEGKLIRIFEYEYPTSQDGETFYPVRDVAIEFTNSDGDGLWTFPRTEARWKLWNLVRYKAVEADQFLERFLRAS